MKILGINAFNISSGGGLTHLLELLRLAVPEAHGFNRVVLWGRAKTLAAVGEYPWLQKESDPLLERGLMQRLFWQYFRFSRLAKEHRCDVVFVPGGGSVSGYHPYATMSRNMLPFEWPEVLRFGFSLMTLKFIALRFFQTASFRDADGMMYLSAYARDRVGPLLGKDNGHIAMVPHGVNEAFRGVGERRSGFAEFSAGRPCRILYVSIVHVYKHHWHVAEAVSRLRAAGLPVTLELVGPPASGSRRLDAALAALDSGGDFIAYHGNVPYAELPEVYAAADLFVFASSCENMPNILVEAMAAGLPIASSDRGPMPEVLGDAGVYFDPEDPQSIAAAVRQYIESPSLMAEKSRAAFERSKQFSWERCARETFSFLAACARGARS